MIQVKDVVKSFDGNVVLNHISANFEDGKVNMIIGQSGSGKTVLMKSMIGLHQINGGEIIFDTRNGQQNLAAMSEKEVRTLHREVGMLFQGAALFDSMTVQENVMYPLEMFSDMSHQEMVERARFCLSRVDMPERAHQLMPSEISGGMQKRVAIARAIALNPRYLFCDEPNSGLDPKTSLVIDQLIQDITQEYGICTIVNSHDMNSIMEIGDNIVFLRNGVKEWQGSRHDIFHAENEALNDFVFASDLFKKVRNAARSV
ncbi:MAG: ATP-binding cassette domain-containing protein [Paludibacteraceae bacterium]|jgi:phospholipid/cholesterol/gamma-HCH transport system ATP-binding protein|nr:ATP-binding cassette domain-containing protein [Paludibacteraceae bacterium]